MLRPGPALAPGMGAGLVLKPVLELGLELKHGLELARLLVPGLAPVLGPEPRRKSMSVRIGPLSCNAEQGWQRSMRVVTAPVEVATGH